LWRYLLLSGLSNGTANLAYFPSKVDRYAAYAVVLAVAEKSIAIQRTLRQFATGDIVSRALLGWCPVLAHHSEVGEGIALFS
jgi:hypothetical protein